ncbi:hypothetical protein [Ruegeria atlantica]|uniref:Uncharacterized protein n=1 Tax=Ruegeria atlantica TaxID=81569 RepID=A0A0P1EFR1_9RHOB|nr:hypothetical protein [Ruegeria atlantica]CUH48961.1 hypothetical protein RUA4292_03152 [Ruegeria atlantica]
MKRPTPMKFTRKPFAWTANVEGIGTVPVFHKRHNAAFNYQHDAKASPQFDAQMDALEATKRMILQIDASDDDLKCLGYVGGTSSTRNVATVYVVDNIQIDRVARTVSFGIVGAE